MTVEQFVAARRDGWQRLSSLCDRMEERGAASLEPGDLAAFGVLYRQSASDLAYARSHIRHLELVSWLNRLVARAHGRLYAHRRRGLRGLGELFATYPAHWRAAWPTLAVAAAVLLGSVAVAFVLVVLDERHAVWFVPTEVREQIVPDTTGQVPPGAFFALFDFILINNVTAALLAFASGIVFGLGTLASLLRNGLLLGGLAGVAWQASPGSFWAFLGLVSPHGPVELAALITCGAAGLELGYALLAGGRVTRREALLAAGRRALRLVLGALPWFAVAAFIEGFVTPLPLPTPVKVLIGLLTAGALGWYLLARPRGVRAAR